MTERTDPKQILRTLLQIDSDALLDAILSCGEVRLFKKGDTIYEYGKLPQQIGFQLSGILATLVPNDCDKLIVDCISDSVGMPIMPTSGMDKPAATTFRVLTSAQIFLCPTEVIARLLAENAALQQRFIDLVSLSIQYNVENRRALQNESVRERYEWFLQKHPNFPERGLNKYVAAYLNMTPETISRLRRERRNREEKPM